MNTKQLIKRLFFITITLAACTGLVILLVAAIGKKNQKRCKDYVITIKGAQKNLFINENDIRKLLDSNIGGKIKDEAISDFNLRKLEQQIKENAWVQNANLYFDNMNVLHISVLEKEPIARIFTSSAKSFYIDNDGKQMPLSDMMSARVPVFTNFPDKKFLSTKDSLLLNDIKKTATFILNDSFWMAQTEQIDITEGKNFEMVPTVGNHLVKLGNGDDIDKKFHRLLVFYQQVMSKTGFDRYNMVDVQYDGQVIGSKTKTSKVDSIQLKKNVEKLLQEAKQMQKDSIAATPITEKENISPDQENTAIDQEQTNSNPLKTTTSTKPKLIVKKAEGNQPRAIMPKKDEK